MANQKNKIVKIKVGLGNQLFQIAFAIFLKKISACEVVLDISWFESQSLRKFQVTEYLRNLDFKIKSIRPSFFNKVISYRSEWLKIFFLKKDINLPISFYDGYWQQIYFARHSIPRTQSLLDMFVLYMLYVSRLYTLIIHN